MRASDFSCALTLSGRRHAHDSRQLRNMFCIELTSLVNTWTHALTECDRVANS